MFTSRNWEKKSFRLRRTVFNLLAGSAPPILTTARPDRSDSASVAGPQTPATPCCTTDQEKKKSPARHSYSPAGATPGAWLIITSAHRPPSMKSSILTSRQFFDARAEQHRLIGLVRVHNHNVVGGNLVRKVFDLNRIADAQGIGVNVDRNIPGCSVSNSPSLLGGRLCAR